ncbi:hypothetical protein N7451_002123 [Penicillium sp. IBT 35674x]|nr:hypothetical protein N7451_002123 [Penicillium sp. IBT 35674x]
MRLTLGVALSLLLSSGLVSAQTYTSCNPTKKSCPADPALGKSDQTYSFTSGASSAFTASGTVTYDSTNGASFTVAKKGDGPLIQSDFYIMFGRVEYTIKAAPGTGIVSSAVLQSDDLDEIDFEWLGGDNTQVQTNYFGKGDTSTYNRGAFSANSGNHDDFHTYSVDWTSSQIVWAIDGTNIRVLTPATADTNQYPQTPMMIKVGVWAGGDSSNPSGTIQWAGGETDYSKGPFTMYMKSMTVTDYSTGNSYSYSDKTGTWESITSDGGKVNGNKADEPSGTESAPSVTATVSIPIPWDGTHKETATWTTPDTWPWVATDSPTAGSTGSAGWESKSGQIAPPTGGSLGEHSPPPNTPMDSKTKTGYHPQSTFRSTSAHLASSLASSSPSGFETSLGNVTRDATSSTSKSFPTQQKSTATTGPIPTKTSDVAPSVNSAVNLTMAPAAIGILCAFLGGVFIWL